ncbi:TECPR2 [Mytilus coruscus]|uniref:TECPR2 n=1 Tax=Mytilus coruscus TaxID=42192 RepID=A0A6J8BP52_MYTCO|nr:TECPR2 [Mytilus coruscus]
MAAVDIKTEDENPEIRIPKEHTSLDYLLSQIPKKAQKGMLIQCDLHIISLDANEFFIALGSNVGVVFLYNRKNKEIERLRTHSHNDVITCVAIHSGLEHQVAVATQKGLIYLFQLPSVMPSQSKQLQQFIVKDIHKSEVTSLCWSMNGMKLFGGDKKGLVSCTEVDFYAGLCETNICLIENNSEIVQLNHAHKTLLISTNQRSMLYRTDSKVSLVQVGQKDRKIFGKFGAVFIPGLCKPEDAELYACRPGLRIWKSKMDGSVISTYLFKELINNPHPTLELLPFNRKIRMFLPEAQFGPLSLYKEKYIVTWSDSSLFILNMDNTSVIGGTFHVGTIQNIAVTNDEIFILRKDTDRNVIRIAERPETLAGNTYQRLVKDKNLPDFMSETPVKLEKAENTQTTPSPLRFIKENVIDKIKNLDVISDMSDGTSSVSNLADSVDKHIEQKELPPIVKLDNPDLMTIEIFSGIPPITESTDQNITSPIRRDRFNPFSTDDSHELEDDTELDTSNLLLCNKPKPVIHKSSHETKAGQHDSKVSSKVKVDDSSCELNSGSHDRIRSIPINTPTDDIAVSVKTKKKKKKKTESKLSPNIKHQDPDALSQNSIESEATSEHMSDKEKSSDSASNDKVSMETENVNVDISDIIGLKPVESNRNYTEDNQYEHGSDGHIMNKDDVKCVPEQELHNINDKDGVPDSEKVSIVKIAETQINETKVKENLQKSEYVPKEDNTMSMKQEEKPKNNNVGCVVEKDIAKPITDNITKTKQDNKPKPQPSKPIENKAESSFTLDCFFKDNKSNLDIAEKVMKHPKKQSALSKLEKNLASLEEGLAFSGFEQTNQFTRENDAKTKDKKESFNVSQTDSGNDSMHDETLSSESNVTEDTQKKEVVQVPSKDVSPSSPLSSSIYRSNSSSCDDFYTQYNTPANTTSTSGSGLSECSENPLSGGELEEPEEIFDNKTESVKVCDPDSDNMNKSSKVFNTWTEVVTSGNLLSLVVSDLHIWCTDRSSNIWYSNIKSPGIKWVKANGYAKQISVSTSGMIVWRVYKDTVYAGTKITSKHPEGMKWVEAIRGVQSVSVDNNCAWYIKSNGEVAIQKGLSRDRPCYKSTLIECSSYKLQHIVCRSGVVWAITDQCKLVYRAGVKRNCQEGKEWAEYVNPDGMMFSSVSFGDGNLAWAVDVLGRIYFMTNVSMETPLGDNCWWQVPINNEITTTDYTLIDGIKSLAKVFDPQKLADLIGTQRGGLIAAGTEGVWVCPDCKYTLQLCRGSMEGHCWNGVFLSGIVASTAWKLISVAAIHLEWGLIWAQQPNGEIFTFTPTKKKIRTEERPPKGQFVCMSVCEEAVWGLNEDGKVYIRSGIADHCPEGAKWCDLDLKQLGDAHLIHLSCGSRNVWALDSDGVVYQRIGVKAPSTHSLQAAWLPVDSGPSGTTFIQVFTGPSDLYVWAIDNRRQTYVRIGITDDMPIGTAWIHIPGIQAQELALSNTFLWALDPNGEVLCRHNITKDNPGGDYWRKIPGIFIHISCSVNDQLWALSREGQIFCRKTRYLLRKELPQDAQKGRKSSNLSISEDWELV